LAGWLEGWSLGRQVAITTPMRPARDLDYGKQAVKAESMKSSSQGRGKKSDFPVSAYLLEQQSTREYGR